MSAVTQRLGYAMAGLLAAGCLNPVIAAADDAAGPRYTYVGAGYEWGDSKCAIEPEGTSLSGYSAEGSVGILKGLHVLGSYYDGETGGPPTAASGGVGQPVNGSVIKEEFVCYEIGAGVSYSFAPGADIVLRGYYVDVDIAHSNLDQDGFEPELLVRYAVSENAEIQAGMAYYDLDEETNSEVRLALIYNVMPWLAVKLGGSVFDDDTRLIMGVRAYFGGNLF